MRHKKIKKHTGNLFTKTLQLITKTGILLVLTALRESRLMMTFLISLRVHLISLRVQFQIIFKRETKKSLLNHQD